MAGMGTIFLGVALACAVTGIALMMAMAGALHARGHRINVPFLRLFILRYIGQYRRVTIRESGRPGPLFHPFVVAMNLALIFAILGLVLRAG